MNAHPFVVALDSLEAARRVGYVRRVSPGQIEALGPLATLGDICEIACRSNEDERQSVLAEVAAVEDDHIVLIPFDQTASIVPDARVALSPAKTLAPVGDVFGGRAIDALGEPIDEGPPILAEALRPIAGIVLPPMEREEPDEILETGVRALDATLPIGRGQRIGVFAASGVGKTTLIRQLAAQVACDRCVLALVGERGREVEAIWRELSQSPDKSRYTCVAATSDLSPVLRARAIGQALSLAEYWRARGEHVLLIVDSVTRYAMALREIGLAAGAPPTLRAYTPNVFSALPRLVERCGAARAGGSITAIVTILSETDDVDDPIAEVMKSLLDGHIVLSRQLAEQGHFPAIDVTRSISRQAPRLMSPAHARNARKAIAALATYEDARIMIDSGLYKPGGNVRLDEAVRGHEALVNFLQQPSSERIALSETLNRLNAVMGGAHA